MFLMINLGERAGSGLPKISQGWETNGGTLRLFDSFEPYNQTRLEMTWLELSETSGKTSGKILEAIRNHSDITIPELSLLTGVTERSIERNIQNL